MYKRIVKDTLLHGRLKVNLLQPVFRFFTSFVATVNYQVENYNLETSNVDIAIHMAVRVER